MYQTSNVSNVQVINHHRTGIFLTILVGLRAESAICLNGNKLLREQTTYPFYFYHHVELSPSFVELGKVSPLKKMVKAQNQKK